MNIKSIIKSLLLEENLTLTQLAKLMSEKSGKKYDLNNLEAKLRRETIQFREVQLIAEVLNRELKFTKK